MKPVVVCTTRLPAEHEKRLKKHFRVRFSRTIGNANGLFCLLSDRIDAKTLGKARNLKMVSIMAVGFNNVDVTEATRRKILVTNTPGVLTDTTADLAWALLLSTARRVVEGDRDVRAGRFHGWKPFDWLGHDVSGATLGIIGPGRIGMAVAKRAKGFGMTVLTAKRNIKRVLARSDFLSIHCPLTPETRRLIGRKELRSMKRTSILINTARGEIVDEKALVEALGKGWIAGAGLDVYEREPKVERALLKMKNVVLLPHIGSASHATRNRMARIATDNLIAGLAGRRPKFLVNPEARQGR